MRRTRKKAQVEGFIVGSLRYFLSASSGCPVLKFMVRTNTGIFNIIAFKELATTHESVLKAGTQVIVLGSYNDKEDEDNHTVIADYIDIPAAPLTLQEQKMRMYGTEENYNKKKAENEKYYSDRGFVPVIREIDGKKTKGWARKNDCVEYLPFKWAIKIEHAMDVLGGAYVSARIRNCMGIDFNVTNTEAFDNKLYKELLEELIKEAKEASLKPKPIADDYEMDYNALYS